ncbi:unnamed protein product [Didymodactylos carnosus]|uniref:Uncharacterized protein n=1 Tax=Didymodactylos carnosus TaxID=1234261 RepID=A0A815WR22_9BILA|nr:unnamed protein product [Didymodactylos carnosus]CAF1548574.1 unnamed protein product [Didymodactylos carnosus]CAF4171842.1 unnamed protein product [Didymodactylos carnosus]CAF4409420.1 unnamed protein product [Didymodactylos carnosus]
MTHLSDDSEDDEKLPPRVDRFDVDRSERYFIGKDYGNYYKKDFEHVDEYDKGIISSIQFLYDRRTSFILDFLDRTKTPRLPWHDQGMVLAGEVARDLARHFISRWNIHKVLTVEYSIAQ